MVQISLDEAAAHLGQIIEQAAHTQQEIILTSNNLAVARITPVALVEKAARKPRQPGSAVGLVTVPADFDAPLDDFTEYR